ncbi:MAG: NAD-glutamate dehydrogenase, partial [Actinobacteria bacterium]|nr:NAD-glutamate dehydrogenase [Actinomycetota bacterium]
MTSVEPAGDAPATAAGAATSRTLAPLLERLEHMVHPARLSLARAFALAMLRRVPDEQLEATDPETLASEVAAAFQFVDERTPGQLALRTLDAPVSIDGWSDPGTVVEVCVEDRPFLLSSLNEELRRLGHQIVRTFHPIFGVERDDAGRLTAIVPARAARQRDAFLHVELDRRLPEDEHESLQGCLRVVLEDVLGATRDYPAMRTRLLELAQAMRAGGAPEHLEVAQLIEWLLADNFVLLGCRDYDLVVQPDGRPAIAAQAGSGLGTLADTSDSHYSEPVALDDADEGFRRRHAAPDVLTVARSHRFSTVHRRARMLNIWVKRLDDGGQVSGEFRLIGLFSRKAFAESSTTVPVLRRKLAHVLEREDIVQGSHDERTFVSLFEALPKDELFEADLDTLHATLLQLFEAEERREVRLQVRIDTFTRTASALVALPRDRYDVHLRKRLQALFLEAFGGESVDVDLSLGNRPDAIVRFAVHLREGARPTVAFDELEAEVRALCRTWEDDVRDALVAAHGEAGGQHLTRDYAQRLSQAYRDRTPPTTTVRDIEVLDELVRSSDELTVELAADTLTDRPLTRVKVFKVGAGIELSRILPILESLGLTVVEELPFRLVGDDPELHVHDYGVHLDGRPLDEARHVERVRAAILAAWRGALEIDSLNRLV